MLEKKGPLIACLAIGAAFLISVSAGSLKSIWASLTSSIDSVPSNESPAVPQNGAPQPTRAVASPNANGTTKVGSIEEFYGVHAQPQQNPSAAGSMADTLDSIQPGNIADSRRERRNLYFEKLSRELKELQGEQPKISPPPEVDDEMIQPIDSPPALPTTPTTSTPEVEEPPQRSTAYMDVTPPLLDDASIDPEVAGADHEIEPEIAAPLDPRNGVPDERTDDLLLDAIEDSLSDQLVN